MLSGWRLWFPGVASDGVSSTRGDSVVVVDNLETSELANICALLNDVRFKGRLTFYEMDITDKEAMEAKLLLDYKFDRVFNFACPASPDLYQRDPVKTLLTNVQGIYNLLCIAEKHGAR